MPASLELATDKAAYTEGDTINVTVTVKGADDVAAKTVTVPLTGTADVDGVALTVTSSVDITRPGVTHTVGKPTVAGQSFGAVTASGTTGRVFKAAATAALPA